MPTLEGLFIKEFYKNIRSSSVEKDIFSIPLPVESKSWKVSGSDEVGIKGIPSEAGLYTGLNKKVVKKLPRGVVASKRKVDIVTRDFMRDDKNRFIYEDAVIPSGSTVIVAEESLQLPFGYKCDVKGFDYVDFIQNGKTREYLYVIPKIYLYETHQTALALSVKNMKNYKGMGYQTWKNGVIYLHIIPYKPNIRYVGTKILKTGYKLDYGSEIKAIVDFWIEKSIIPNVVLSDTTERGNLVLKPTMRGYEEYNPIEEISLGDKEIYGDVDQNLEE